jgi:S1-C subfamily serine protease
MRLLPLPPRPQTGSPRPTRRPSGRLARLAPTLAAALLLVAACGSSPAAPAATAPPTSAGVPASSAAAAASPGASTPPIASDAPAPSPVTAAGSGSLAELQNEYEAVVRKVAPSVVVIETSSGLGSGIIFDTAGDIVTNAHVVGSASSFTVTLADGRQVDGSLVGIFAANDVAVIKISATGLHPATFADSSKLQVGQIVMAVGNPLGLQTSVTQGIVSALGRTVTEPGGVILPGTIQTSAAINPGNSGGALVDVNGQVVGIPTLAAVDQQIGGAAPGIGFAIPSNDASDFAKQLIQDGKVTNSHRAYLGIRSADVLAAQGVLVYAVESGGPAAQAGIRAGELIVSIDGQPTPDSNTLAVVLAGLQPGQRVPVKLREPNGSTSTVEVTLGEIPG